MIVATLIATAIAECPNACSAHGKCGAYDMCTCYRNWMSSDCSERICQFGLAHVDTPKGDLDASGGKLTGPDTLVAVNDFVYPYGTTEQYPSVKDIDDRIQQNTAHEYRECSNKGICDRTTGTCTCFEGYEGSACQRASCPTNANGVCSGHGTCQSISDIARNDYNNIYKLWDEDATMGCVCDGGYEGPDCSQRKCKYGTDPLYFDKNATIRYSNWTYGFHTQAASAASNTFGNYSLIFYDSYGEDWQTDPIPITANCDQLTNILERLPNDVVPRDSVRCYKYQVTAGTTTLGGAVGAQPAGPIVDTGVYLVTQFIIAFTQNPGKLKQPEINIYLDGTRRTLYTNEAVSTLGWYLYPDGFHGEDVDYVPNRCAGVTAKITLSGQQYLLSDLSNAEKELLKICLADADGDESTKAMTEVYNWDYGTVINPHLIKLQDATQYNLPWFVGPEGGQELDNNMYIIPKTRLCTTQAGNQARFGSDGTVGFCANLNPPPFYALLYFSSNEFRLMTNAGADYTTATEFFIYTTTGTVRRVSPMSAAFTTINGPDLGADFNTKANAASYFDNVVRFTNISNAHKNYFGDISCETNPTGANGAIDCINKNDLVFILHDSNFVLNPKYPNMYTVKKIANEDKTYQGVFPRPTTLPMRLQMTLDYSLNGRFDLGSVTTPSANPSVLSAANGARVYKFYPPTGYRHTGACSTRGVCNTDSGVCECFNGYTGDNCASINALAH